MGHFYWRVNQLPGMLIGAPRFTLASGRSAILLQSGTDAARSADCGRQQRRNSPYMFEN